MKHMDGTISTGSLAWFSITINHENGIVNVLLEPATATTTSVFKQILYYGKRKHESQLISSSKLGYTKVLYIKHNTNN